MGWRDIFFRVMAVSAHGFSRVDAYVACGLTTEYDTPLISFQDGRELDNVPIGLKTNIYMNKITKIVERTEKIDGGW